eukprot:CAMPEP_0197315190 /NCGR_PEP_ID=MMETSP0891-20130614/37149_1 /TAXON_ID=44058 ORGANISM="Aureoumbra lagunensis, Strain CCMP1510" /NCGR_SAMPLE_ID=MMETSP0891 /ASSEMBLY_ACC=CAM_ASM_000534 /LENGTH=406 /DNA_ID=CAMNT_0042804027 /DNA_START=202 /DNA_END=1422 /DNA_ORIENTATION=-
MAARLGAVLASTLFVRLLIQPLNWWLTDVIKSSASESSDICRRRLGDEFVIQGSFAEDIDDFEELGLDVHDGEESDTCSVSFTTRFIPRQMLVFIVLLGQIMALALALVPAIHWWWTRAQKLTNISLVNEQDTVVQKVTNSDEEFGPPVFAAADEDHSPEARAKKMLEDFFELDDFIYKVDLVTAYKRLWSNPTFFTSFLHAENEQPQVQDWTPDPDGLLRRRVDCRHPLGVPLPRWCGLRGFAIPTVKLQVALPPLLVIETSNFEGFPFATTFNVQTAWHFSPGPDPNTTKCIVYTRCGFDDMVPSWVRSLVTNKSKDEILLVNKRMAHLAEINLAQNSAHSLLSSAPSRIAYPPLPAGRALDDFLQMRDGHIHDNDADDNDQPKIQKPFFPTTHAVSETSASRI